jgi:hypothetical protein
MNPRYIEVINGTSPHLLYKIPHKYHAAHPTGFVVIINTQLQINFSFTLCPLYICTSETNLPGNNPHDVILFYNESIGPLEHVLYKLWEEYKLTCCDKTEHSIKRYKYNNQVPPRKIIIPCFKRLENITAVLKRFKMIDAPPEGYKPQILLVEHSTFQEIDKIAEDFDCEYLWILLDPRIPDLPLGQFNKALCYDKSFIFGSPATWYLFHDNDILVPKTFWSLLDANVNRSGAKFLQPYTHRTPLYLHEAISEELRKNLQLVDMPIDNKNIQRPLPGAPGGSLYIHRDRYLDVGGHDPNLCWGYGPEDLLFFNKLQTLEPIAYADEPPIEMVHLWHPSAATYNPLLRDMDIFVKGYFMNLSSEQKKKIMEEKKSLLISILSGKL